MMFNKIIIWSRDNYNSLGLLRQLSGEGREIFFLMWGKKTGCASSSVFFGAHTNVSSIEDGYKYLLSHFREETLKPVIITPSDEIIEFIDQHRTELLPYFILPGTKTSGILTKIQNKNKMSKLAKELGFLVPASRVCKWDSDISDVQFPCIIKPSQMTNGHINEFKFLICDNKKQLNNTLKYVRHESEFILQQYIPKESVALVYGARMNDGEVKTAGVLIKDRFLACGDGSHGMLKISYPNGIDEELIRKFLVKIDYYGLFSFEYGICNNKAYFFEVNLRNDGTSHYFYQAGANIPLAWYYSMIDKDYSKVNTKITKDAWFIDEIYDITNVWNGTITKKQWTKEKQIASVFKYYDINDINPWIKTKSHRLKDILRDIIIKKFRLYIVWIMRK